MNDISSSSDPWWTPEVLAKREEEIRLSEDPASSDVRNDFASYRALADGRNTADSGLHLHNECETWRIDTICRDYGRVARKYRHETPRNVADLGCGAGFTTDGLRRLWPNAGITGFELSRDAVKFARRTWSGCVFVEGAITPGTPLTGAPFDTVICQEFYPFTRTGSVEHHLEWLAFICDNLAGDGIAILMVSAATDGSVNDTYKKLRAESGVRRVSVLVPRLSRRMPWWFSRLAATGLSRVRPLWVRHLYVMTRSGMVGRRSAG